MSVKPGGIITTDITISLVGTYKAVISIEGKSFEYGYNFSEGYWSFSEDLSNDERDNTIGGAIAMKIKDILPAILQNYMPEEYKRNGDCYETWDKLPKKLAEKVSWDMESAL